jgi:LacI family transcriptional regulator
VPPKGVVVRQSTNILAIPHEYVAMALRLIWENYIRNIGVADIANEVPMSYPQLHASFVKYVGHSIGEELTRRRVEHAQRLLSDPEIKAHEVARQSGFTSADHMSRVFNRRLGISVSEYRK